MDSDSEGELVLRTRAPRPSLSSASEEPSAADVPRRARLTRVAELPVDSPPVDGEPGAEDDERAEPADPVEAEAEPEAEGEDEQSDGDESEDEEARLERLVAEGGRLSDGEEGQEEADAGATPCVLRLSIFAPAALNARG